MAHKNTVMRSVNAPDGGVCVDLFQRPDGSFGFDTFRRDPEDPSGWFCIGHHGHQRFASEEAAWHAARAAIDWLSD